MLVEKTKAPKQSKNTIEFNNHIPTVKSTYTSLVTYRKATLGERFSAVLLNLLFLFVFIHFFEFVFPNNGIRFIVFLFYILLQLVLMKIWGQTLGKKIMKIRVCFRNEKEKLSFGYYIIREFRSFFHFFVYFSSAIFYIVLVFKFVTKLINWIRGKEKINLNSLIDTDDIVVLKEIKVK